MTCLGQKGHIAFYGLVILPFVLTISILAIDVSEWSYLRDLAQKEADRLAYEAALILPDKDRVYYKLHHTNLNNPKLKLAWSKVTNSSVNVTVEGKIESSFDFILARTSDTQAENLFQVQRQAKVQILPNDVVLILADGATLRPNVGTAPWGNELEWPASQYYSCSAFPAVNEYAGQTISSDPERWATQSCFNPIWSNLKYAAIRLVDNFSAGEHNRIGVIFTPGDQNGSGFQVLRHIREDSANLYSGHPRAGFFRADGLAQAYWRPYVELSTRTGDELCLLLSHPNFDSNYTLSSDDQIFINPNVKYDESCNDPLQLSQCDATGVPYGRMDPCYINHNLSLREAIYWHAARLFIDEAPATPNILAALRQATIELMVNSEESTQVEQQQRGNVAYSTPRKLFIFTDTLPNLALAVTATAFDEIFVSLSSQNVEIVLVAFSHQGLQDGGIELENNLKYFESLSQRLKLKQNTLRIFHLTNTEEIATKVIPIITQFGRSLVLMN